MALSCLVFDFDGVLFESVDAKTRAMAKLAEPFGPRAVDALVGYHVLHGGMSRFEKFTWFFQEIVGRPISREEMEDWSRRFLDYADEAVSGSALVPGAMDVLERWRDVVPMYVASGAPHVELNRILSDRGLASYFRQIFGYPPPKDVLLREILRQGGYAPKKTVMIGDSKTDLDAAVINGTLFYGRGSYFAGMDWPWYADLTRLNDYLAEVAAA